MNILLLVVFMVVYRESEIRRIRVKRGLTMVYEVVIWLIPFGLLDRAIHYSLSEANLLKNLL